MPGSLPAGKGWQRRQSPIATFGKDKTSAALPARASETASAAVESGPAPYISTRHSAAS